MSALCLTYTLVLAVLMTLVETPPRRLEDRVLGHCLALVWPAMLVVVIAMWAAQRVAKGAKR